jgi:tetratricopeptide (TPR) repeat protein
MGESDVPMTQTPPTMTPQQMMQTAFALHRSARSNEAEALYQKLLVQDPQHAEALFGLGLLRLQQGRHDEAIGLTRQALDRRPDWADAHGNLGTAFMGLGRVREAADSFARAIACNPRLAKAHLDLATASQALGRYEEALRHGETALALSPDSAQVHATVGAALLPLSRFDEALAHATRAVELDPKHLGLHSLLGVVLRSLNRPRDAIAAYDRALAIKPDHAEAHWNQSVARLTDGDFEAGWRQFEWRWRNPALGGPRRQFQQPLWLGDSGLAGKTLLIHAEQGYGDTIQFARYVPLVARQAAHTVLEVPQPLVSLLSGLDPTVTVVPEGETLPPFDLHCPFMSLPLAFGTRLETIPADVPYLAVPKDQTETWRRRLAPLPGLRVGLVWAGAPRHSQPSSNALDRRRSVSLAHFARFAGIPGLSLVSVQKGEAAVQAQSPPDAMQIHDWTDLLNDFSDTAALVEALDLVISVDTSVVHLVGALGKPVWMLNRFDTCWRWLLGRDDSRWYPTLRQFRQPAPGDWGPVIDAVTQALTQLVSYTSPIAADDGGSIASLNALF